MSTAGATTRSTEETARAYFDALAQGDVEAMAACWKPGTVDHIHGTADMRVPDGLKTWFGDLFRAFPDFAVVVVDLVCQDNRAAVRWSATGTFNGTGSFQGLQPNGASVETEGFDLLTIEGGLVVDNHAYTNELHVLRQVGTLPPQGSRAETAMTGAFNLKTRLAGALKRS